MMSPDCQGEAGRQTRKRKVIIARQRAEDAGAAGLDGDTQAIVREGAYEDCMAWTRAHPAAP
ncbi:MAG TPA: hypothetical protein VGL35_09310 [Rhizomicrobium sp.]|jgi:hypothetical protein